MPRKALKAGLTLLALALAVLAALGTVDTAGRDYTEAGFKRALITFGIARGLNGVISVAQGTEVAFEPAGIGVVFAPGQILDPVNDLIEQFSWVMLASATSLGIQRVLLDATAWPAFTLLVGLLLVAATGALWWPGAASPARRGLYRVALVMVILRFAVPLIAIASEVLYAQFLEPQYDASNRHLEQTTATLGELSAETRPPLAADDSSLLDSMRRGYASAAAAMNVDKRLETFKRSAAEISEHTVNLIVVFVLQTILLPLLFLWLVVQLMRYVVRLRFGGVRE
ncbi:MAG: hypothetical protein K8I04_02495 [Gammaproteobacteria bacterium]|nr:hypothetical protein [Gammaproteobacteria bacterium]